MEIDEQVKTQLARQLCAILDGWTLPQAMDRWGIWPSRLSELRHGRVDSYSIASLLRLIARMGYDVEVTLRPHVPEPRPVPSPSARVVRYDRSGRPVE